VVASGCVTSIADVERESPGGGGAAGASTGGGSTGGSGATSSGGTGATGGGTGGAEPDGSSGGAAGAQAGGSGGLAGSGTLEVLAAVADCIDLTNPNPDQCESIMGKYQMVVDEQNSAMIGQSGAGGGPPTAVFLRFELSGELAQKTITSVTLDMTITDYTNAGSSSSGQVYSVEDFTRPELFLQAPAQTSGVVGPNQGTVATLETVSWGLPVSVVDDAIVCLGVYPTNIDGAYYYNAAGATPPKLSIDYQ
jgi:hypothetical protein